MTQVFADTSFYVALANPADQLHAEAMAVASRLDSAVITTDYILVELGNFLRNSRQRTIFLELEREIRLDEQCSVIPANRALQDRGLELYQQRPDKDWSLTDCISFVVMQDQNVTEALTADRHFEQAGFVPLLVRP